MQISKPVIHYEGGSSSQLTADPEGEEFLEKLNSGYQTRVEAFINLIAVDEPASYVEAISGPNCNLW